MLSRAWTRLWRIRWLPVAAALSAAVLTVAAVAMSVQRLAHQHLEDEAKRAALGWATQVASNVIDLDLIFMGELPSPPAQAQLSAMRGLTGLFRFSLFGPDGTLLLSSDSLGTPARSSDGTAETSALALQAFKTLQPVVNLLHGDAESLPKTYSRAFVPVVSGGTALGVIELDSDQTALAQAVATSFRRASAIAGAAMAVCILLAAALMRHRARLERHARDRAEFLAGHDVLTAALNHGSFSAALAQACRRPEKKVAVMCIDLDHFAQVNEAHGHRAGDELLRITADRLRGLIRETDRLARLAGDRFAILQQVGGDPAAVTALVQRIVTRLAQPLDLPGVVGAVRLSASVGVAVHGNDGKDADALLHNAELALLRAKANGRGGWSFYDPTVDRQLQERRNLAQELRLALAQGKLTLHYQPLFDVRSGELTGYEALARWLHPTLGFIPPSEFIAVAEETGQIESLGRWVVESACTEAQRWPEHLTVAVNLSAAQFQRGSAIVDEVRHALVQSGLRPQRLELEITESLLMSHTETVLGTLRALHGLGARIAMDDFGTGYSSLAYLWRFPFDKLKIDRAFTQGLESDPRVGVIVGSIITLAHSLSIRVNAEGVETESQRVALVKHGCDELQGYLLGRPMPVERLAHVETEVGAVLVAA